MIDYSKLLNPQQCAVVLEASGPSLVLAGAGSGKTRTLIFKLIRLLEEGVLPEHILLLTFTNKAAREMVERVKHQLGFLPKNLWAGTFHGIANRLLRIYGHLVGFPPSFTILDEGDAESLIKEAAKEYATEDKRLPKSAGIKSIFSFAINSQRDLEDVVGERFLGWKKYIPFFTSVRDEYERLKQNAHAMDFDDLLRYWHTILESYPEVRASLQHRFQYILVDEYQDTNTLQGSLIKRLGEHAKLLLAVGDDAQSIYSFRAAEIANILEFSRVFPNSTVYKLEQNYRSQPLILQVANAVIEQNERQYEKVLTSDRAPVAKPMVVTLRDKDAQGEYIADQVLDALRGNRNPSDVAILVRSSYDTMEIEVALSKRSVPYLKRGGIRYFEQSHIKDAVAFLKVFTNPKDYLAWMRILTMLQGVGAKTADRIVQEMAQVDVWTPEVLVAAQRHIPVKGEADFRSLVELFHSFTDRPSPSVMLLGVRTGLYQTYANDTYSDSTDRLDDITSLAAYAARYTHPADFLSDIALSENYKSDQNGGEQSRVIISTIHQAKGLEWDVVFIPSLVEGKFPHARSSDNDQELEEERRLFYVAITRAKDVLYLTYPVTSFAPRLGAQFHEPSRFLDEIPGSLVERMRHTDAEFLRARATDDSGKSEGGILDRVIQIQSAHRHRGP